ncbi:formiminoglutamase [Microbacterium sp. AK009]|uniref:arginase family protein n=1 Tax=Microbacterium sp. AK009 TaxID=2723068 RepID=UPI0017DE262E|nr:arginase family protein [Microbacterium sp. AK009]NYF18498.1 formiminoglutamase [Microbacterium sp. AK009]
MSGLFHDPLWPRAGDWPSAHDRAEASGAVDVAILGVPTWRTSLSATGAHATPAAVREALRRYSPTLIGPPAVDLDAALAIADAGDIAEPDGDDGESRVRRAVAELRARGALVIALGGDNAATVPVAQGARAGGLVTLDAHLDMRDGRSNGSPVRRLIEDGLDPAHIVQIGIADFANSPAYLARARNFGITLVTLDQVRRRPAADLVAEAFEIAGAGAGGVHLDIDVDVCDRSVAPGCPASVPGGLSADALRTLVRSAASDDRLVSADIVEVDATADAEDRRTVRLAALCVLELLAGRAMR